MAQSATPAQAAPPGSGPVSVAVDPVPPAAEPFAATPEHEARPEHAPGPAHAGGSGQAAAGSGQAGPDPAALAGSPERRSHRARHRAAMSGVAGADRRGASRRPRRGRYLAVLAAAAFGVVAPTAVSGQAVAADRPGTVHAAQSLAAPPAVPLAIQPPAGVARVATYRVAFGVQIYTCTAGVWKFKAPEALLVRTSGWWRTIHHSAGPSWKSNIDGSTVTAAKVGESAVAGAIPQLLLQVNSHSGNRRGELANVTHIQRLATGGGLAPTGACTEGAQRPVRYNADYVFFAPR